MKQYLDLGKEILTNGTVKEDRTGTGTISIFGHQMRFNLQDGFPLVTTKEMAGSRFEDIIRELLWFIHGETNIKNLVRNGTNIWNRDAYKQYQNRMYNPMSYKEFVHKIKTDDAFAKEHGDLGPIYGKQWTAWETPRGATINQIEDVIESIIENPDSRRHIVTGWNPSDIPNMALPPCHTLFQFYVANNKLSCQLYQRSGDYLLGIPYNIASYALLTTFIAKRTGYDVGEFIHTIGDAHIYLNHVEQVKEQITRKPYPLPSLDINENIASIYDYTVDDFTLKNYQSHPEIKGKQSF